MMMRAPEADEVIEGKMFAVLSYLSVLCIIPLIFQKQNSFVLSHGKQGLVLFVGEVAVFILHIVLGSWLLRLGMFVMLLCSFFGMIAVLRGQYIRLPYVHEIAQRIQL